MATLGTNLIARPRSSRYEPQVYAPRSSPYHLQYPPSSSDPFPPAHFPRHLSNHTHHHNINFLRQHHQQQQPSSKFFFQDHPPSEATNVRPSGANILQKYRDHESSDFMASILNAQAKEDELKAQEERGASEQERLTSKVLRLKWELQQRRWARSVPHPSRVSVDASRPGQQFQSPPSDYTSMPGPDRNSPGHPSPCDTQAEIVNKHGDNPSDSQSNAMNPPPLPDSTQRDQQSWLHSTRLPPKKLGFKRKSTHQSAVINATRVKVMKNPGKFPHPKEELTQQAPVQVSSASSERPLHLRSSSPESPSSSPPSHIPKMMSQNILKPPRMSYHARLAEAKLRSSRGSPLKLVINAESLQDSCESSASPPPALTHSPLSATPSTSSSTSSSPTLSQHENINPEPCSALVMPPVMTSLPSFGSMNMLS